MATNSYIQVAADGSGKKMQTFISTIGGSDVHAEGVSLVDNNGLYISTLPVSLSSNINIGSNINVAGTVNIGTAPNVNISIFTGAANMFNGQVTATTTPATLVAARPTRRSVSIRHISSSNINVYFGNPVVSSSNGMLLRSLDSISVDYTGLIQVVAGSNSVNVAYVETYD